ncbi:MerR family transcriptional regulator [Angustibacter peucedani]
MRREYTLAEIASAVGMTERNVRAYRSRGLIRPPRMRGRVGYYAQEHLAQLRLVQALLGRGLSLAVITQLVERGVAHTELARLLRDELASGELVELSSLTYEELERLEPGLVDRMADLGLGSRTATGYRSDPTFFALSNLLVSQGVSPLDVARISQHSAECAQQLADRLPSLEVDPEARTAPLDGADAPPTPADLQQCAVELATTAFRLALTTRMKAGTLSAPAP